MATIKSPPKEFKFSTMAGADPGVVQSNSLNWEKKNVLIRAVSEEKT